MSVKDKAVLIVDDDRELAQSLMSGLAAEGYTVDVAETSASVFDKLARRSYGIILLNVSMPEASGLELLPWLQEMAPDSLKIMVSEGPDLDAAVEALKKGADHLLLKPVQSEKLLRVVEKLRERGEADAPIGKAEVTVVVPVLNEEEAIGLVLEELRANGYGNVLVVEGYSTDDTAEKAGEAGATVIMQHGTGKTGAIRTALEHVKTPYLLVMDGDHTYSAGDIERFLPFASRFDQILGSRKEGRQNIGLTHRFGNWIINTALNILFNASVSDVCTGMYMMKTDVARRLELRSGGFNVEVEAAIQNIINGKVTEVPIGFRRRVGRRKLSTWKQGLQILWTVIRLSFSYNPLFFLATIGSIFTVPGALLLLIELYYRLMLGSAGWSIGVVWLGLTLFILGLNSFTIAMFTLISKRQERRIIQQIRTMMK